MIPWDGVVRPGEMVTIPAGSFLMGSSTDDPLAFPDEFPCHRVDVPEFRIGRFEVTRGEYRQFIDAGGYDEPAYWSAEGWEWKQGPFVFHAEMHGKYQRVERANPAAPRREPEHWAGEQEWNGHGHAHPRFLQTDLHPVVGVTYFEAEAYCRWAGGRLPTEAEWEKAARWDARRGHANVWPWGDAWDPEKCNNRDDHHPAGGGCRTNQSTPVGSYPEGASPYGCLDMVGNAYEWVADWARSYPGAEKPFDHTGSFRYVKGGCWDDDASTNRCAVRWWYLPPFSSGTGPGDCDYIGFRMAR